MTKVQIPPACMFSHISYVFSSRTTSYTRKTRGLQDIALKYGPNFGIKFCFVHLLPYQGPYKTRGRKANAMKLAADGDHGFPTRQLV